jgi:iron complex transport system substrate-binding protein
MRKLRTIAAIALPVVLLAACGSDTDTADTVADTATSDVAVADTAVDGGARATSYPLTIENCGFTSTLEAPPERILVSYDVADPLVLWGLSDNIVGWHTYQPLTRYPGLQEQLDQLEVEPEPFAREAIVALKPDLVISASSGVFTPEYGMTREDLAEIGAASWVPESLCAQDYSDATDAQLKDLSARNFGDVLSEMLALGEIVDRQAEAQDLVDVLSTEMALLEDAVEGREPVQTAVFSYYAGELGGVYVGGVAEDYIVRAGGVYPHRDPEAQFKSLSVEELTVTPLDVVLVDSADEGVSEAVLDLFPTWPAADNGRAAFIPGMFSSISAPYVVRDLIEVLHPDVELP